MNVQFTKEAYKDYEYWGNYPEKIDRIKKLLRAIDKNPFKGIGKPEPLKFTLSGFWSRRIDKTHRLVYKYENNEITVISCRYHY